MIKKPEQQLYNLCLVAKRYRFESLHISRQSRCPTERLHLYNSLSYQMQAKVRYELLHKRDPLYLFIYWRCLRGSALAFMQETHFLGKFLTKS